MMLKRITSLLVYLILHGTTLFAQTYYVSSTEGSNNNDGLTEKTPKADLKEVPFRNVTIRLKCGDVFWGGLMGYTNCTIESYGEGSRPVICGFKVLKNTDAWQQIGDNIWILDLTKKEDFVGYFSNNEDETRNNIGFIYDPQKDKLYGHNVAAVDLLNNDMDFFTSEYYGFNDVKEHPFKNVIVKSKSNPGFMGNLCFPMSQYGVNRMTDCNIRGLAIVGFSKMGMVHLQGCLVDICRYDY